MSRRSRRIDEAVVCPFYNWSSPNRICCEGILDDNTTNLIFGNPILTDKYMRVYCCSLKRYKECKLGAMLQGKYGG